MKQYFIFTSVLLFTLLALVLFWILGSPKTEVKPIPDTPTSTTPIVTVTNFDECANVSGVVMESYPRQCRYNGETFSEYIGDELEKQNLIQVSNPRPNQVISTPLTITGQARGTWFFEASFPVMLTNWDGLIIAQGIAQAQSEWMTEEFVPFSVTLTFEYPTVYDRGYLILQKDNPSGLSEFDDALEIPVKFSATSSIPLDWF